MTYTTISTPNANYVLQLGHHFNFAKNKQVDVFTGIDALVVETGLGRLEHFLSRENNPQYSLAFNYCVDNTIPIFSADVKTTIPFGELRFWISLESFPVLFLSPYGFSTKRVNDLVLSCFGNILFLGQGLISEARNAVSARKIEEYIAPIMAERLGRKPYLGLIWGVGHMGLKPDLQSKKRRDFTLWNWEKFNFKPWAGLVREDLNVIDEGNYNGSEWELTKHAVELFNV